MLLNQMAKVAVVAGNWTGDEYRFFRNRLARPSGEDGPFGRHELRRCMCSRNKKKIPAGDQKWTAAAPLEILYKFQESWTEARVTSGKSLTASRVNSSAKMTRPRKRHQREAARRFLVIHAKFYCFITDFPWHLLFGFVVKYHASMQLIHSWQ